ncbi:MAG: protease HtpX [Elusimicrobia bacterium]|nr:protease HtpX [Elusimicrobiota bacterium]
MFRIAKRLILFFAVNLLIILTLSFTLNILGVRPYLDARGINYSSLMIFCLVWGMGGAFISLALSRITAKWMMGVSVIDPNTSDSDLSWLVNTVHKLARSAGLSKMPEVGIYDSPEINAFATGPTRNRSLVAVSAGLLENMNKEQIEGVLAHEVAHISNGDMVTMTLLQGIINAIVMFLARIIAYVVVSRRNSDDDSPSLRYFVTFVLEIILSFLGMIVVAAFSRYREYRADAGGASLAGREKMISALKALLKTVRYADLTGKESIASFKISGTPKFMKLFSTHPPLEERIERLERGF